MIKIISYSRVLAVFFAICLGPAIGDVSAADTAKSRRANVEKLLHVTGAVENGRAMSEQVISQVISSLKAKRPNATTEELEEVRVAANSVISERFPELVDALIPIYEKYYTEAEVKLLIEFYSTDLGKKINDVSPRTMKESFSAGIVWGESLESDIIKRLIQSQSSLNAPTTNEPPIVVHDDRVYSNKSPSKMTSQTLAAKRPYDLSGLISDGKRVVIQTPAMPLRSSNVEPRKRSVVMVLEQDASGGPIAYRQFVTVCNFQERKSVVCKQNGSDKRFQFERDVHYEYKARKQAFICTMGCGPHTPAALTETAAIPIAFPNLFEP